MGSSVKVSRNGDAKLDAEVRAFQSMGASTSSRPQQTA
jgi:hypothetical protein